MVDYNLTRRATISSMSNRHKAGRWPDNEITSNFGVYDNQIYATGTIEIGFVSGFGTKQFETPEGRKLFPNGVSGGSTEPPNALGMAKEIFKHFGSTDENIQYHEHSGSMTGFVSGHYGAGVSSVSSFKKKFSPHIAISASNNKYTFKKGSAYEVFTIMDGTMFTSISDIPVSPKECIGYSMMGEQSKAQIIIDEAVADPMYDWIVDQGGPDLRRLPFSMAALDALPEILQPMVLKKLSMQRAEEHKALEVSMMKELMDSETGRQLIDILKEDIILSGIKISDRKELTDSVKFLIEKGWARSL